MSRLLSSEVEHLVYTEAAGGSIPSASIINMRLNAVQCYLPDVSPVTRNFIALVKFNSVVVPIR